MVEKVTQLWEEYKWVAFGNFQSHKGPMLTKTKKKYIKIQKIQNVKKQKNGLEIYGE